MKVSGRAADNLPARLCKMKDEESDNMRKNSKRVLSLVLMLAMVLGMMTTTAFAANTGSADGFTDVSADDWYYDAVRYMSNQGIMNGTSTTGKVFSRQGSEPGHHRHHAPPPGG